VVSWPKEPESEYHDAVEPEEPDEEDFEKYARIPREPNPIHTDSRPGRLKELNRSFWYGPKGGLKDDMRVQELKCRRLKEIQSDVKKDLKKRESQEEAEKKKLAVPMRNLQKLTDDFDHELDSLALQNKKDLDLLENRKTELIRRNQTEKKKAEDKLRKQSDHIRTEIQTIKDTYRKILEEKTDFENVIAQMDRAFEKCRAELNAIGNLHIERNSRDAAREATDKAAQETMYAKKLAGVS